MIKMFGRSTPALSLIFNWVINHVFSNFKQLIYFNKSIIEKRIALWNVLRKRDALEAVCANGSRLYYTPNDCFHISQRYH